MRTFRIAVVVALGSGALAASQACSSSGGGPGDAGQAGTGTGSGTGKSDAGSGSGKADAGSGSGKADAGSGSGSGSPEAGSGSGSSDAGSGSGSGDGGNASCAVPMSGLVTLTKETAPNAGNIVTASFFATPFSGEVDALACNPGCKFYPPSDAGNPTPMATVGVGTVTATDTTTSTSKALTQAAGLAGPAYGATTFAWSAGDALSIVGGPGDAGFPMFTVTGTAPATLTATSPAALATGGTVTASKAAGLTVTWTPASPPATFVYLGLGAGTGGQMNCYVADSAGTLTVPSTVLAQVPNGTYTNALYFGRWNARVDSSSGVNIGVQAEEFLARSVTVGP